MASAAREWNKALSALRRSHQWESVLDLVATMRRVSVSPDAASLNIGIAAYQHTSRWRPALQLLAEFGKGSSGIGSGLRAGLISFNTCICFDGCRTPFWPQALSLLGEVVQQGMWPDAFSFTGVMRALRSASGSGWLRSWLLLSQRHRTSVVMHNCALSTLSAGEGAGSWITALCLLESMDTSSCLPDVVSLTSAISSCEEKWRYSLSLQKRKLEQIQPNLHTWNAMLGSCTSASEWQFALCLFVGSLGLGVKPDTISMNSLAITSSDSDETCFWKFATHLLQSMHGAFLFPRWAVRPDEISYNSAMTSLEKAGSWMRSLGLSSHMSKMLVRRTVVSLGRTICAWTRGTCWSHALQAFTEMTRSRIRANLIAFNNALDACESEWCSTLELLEGLRLSGFGGNAVSYSCAANALTRCADSALWPLSLNLWHHMSRESVDSNEVAHNGFINACGGSSWNMALEHVFCMGSSRIIPNLISINSALAACQSMSCWLSVLSLLDYMPLAKLMPDLISFADAAEACARAGQLHPTLRLLNICDMNSFSVDGRKMAAAS
ncbi:unnamed protein product [Symbiodinium natans]|uniref:Pentatricopeptide repeat-containing protein, chloroplastic n=1 Tax=Symbiodinium natans TaxID=878477 RepID=A0A812SEP8_9DINO|nr:unnamed protein product [Symbiodinium natans]